MGLVMELMELSGVVNSWLVMQQDSKGKRTSSPCPSLVERLPSNLLGELVSAIYITFLETITLTYLPLKIETFNPLFKCLRQT